MSAKAPPQAITTPKEIHSVVTWKNVLVAILCVTAGNRIYSQFFDSATESLLKDYITTTEILQFQQGLQTCQNIKSPYLPSEASSSRVNPRWEADVGKDENGNSAPSKAYLLGNATLFDGKSFLEDTVDIFIRDGVFKSIVPSGSSIPISLLGGGEMETIDLAGKHVTPGMIDLHSHLGMMPMPYLTGDDDTNEVTAAITSYVRAIDSFSPLDPAIPRSASGGVTSALVLPGSANNIGGEAIAVKLRLPESSLVEDMLVEKDVKGKRRRWMKMACGENPKRVHRNRAGYGSGASEIPPGPSTRMGSAYHLRQHFDKARRLQKAQDMWCEKAETLSSTIYDELDNDALDATEKESIKSLGEFPDNISLESTVGILRDEILVNTHCYLGQDMETMIRVADEFNFRVTAFHHALSASRVSKFLAEHPSTQNITVATFAEFALYKAEAYDHDLRNGAVLADAGVKVVYKSDNPAVDPKYLMREAAFGHHFDLPADLSIAAVTSTPANAMGLGHRIGYVREGYDADLVIWDDYPLSIGATPVNVFIDGSKLYSDDQLIKPKNFLDGIPKSQKKHLDESKYAKHGKADEAQVEKENTCENTIQVGGDMIVKGIQKSFLNPRSHLGTENTSSNLTLTIRAGKISCLGTCEQEEKQMLTVNANTPTMWLENGHVLPPLTSVSEGLGQVEIEGERSTSVGTFKGDNYKDADDVVYTKESLFLGGKMMGRVRYGGVYRAITPPLSSGFLSGVSVAFKTDGQNLLENGTIVKDAVALHVKLGFEALDDKLSSKAQQVKALREILTKSQAKYARDLETLDVYSKVAVGKIPVAVEVGAKDLIYQVIALKKSFPQVKFVIVGGADAWMAAEDLAAAKVPVVLKPWTCGGESLTWEVRNCLRGPPLTEAATTYLQEAGVEFALAPKADAFSISLITDASWAAGAAGMSSQEAVNLVSYNIEKIFDLPVSTGKNGERLDFVIWEGNPLEFGARIAMVVDEVRGSSMLKECWPKLV